MKKINAVILVLIMTLFSGCHTFYKVGLEDLQSLRSDDIVKVELKNGSILSIKRFCKANVVNNGQEIEFVSFDSSPYINDFKYVSVLVDNIKRISVKRFDTQKTILAPIFITM